MFSVFRWVGYFRTWLVFHSILLKINRWSHICPSNILMKFFFQCFCFGVASVWYFATRNIGWSVFKVQIISFEPISSEIGEEDSINNKFLFLKLVFFSLLVMKLKGTWFLFATYDEGLPLHGYSCIRFTYEPISAGEINATQIATNPENTYVSKIRRSSCFLLLNFIFWFLVAKLAKVLCFLTIFLKESTLIKQVISK